MGFIKLDRKLLTWEWKDDPNMVALWIEILLQANYYDSRWHGQEFEKGSFPTSLAKLSEATGLTVNQVRTCLRKLKSTHEITYKSTNQGTKISVVKWAFYQGCDDDDNTQNNTQDNNQITNEAQTNHNTIRNIRKKEGKKKDILPIYDPSINKQMSKEEEEELLELLKGEA